MKATLKELSFNVGGHTLHTLFWANMAPAAKTTKEPDGALAEARRTSSAALRGSRRSSLQLQQHRGLWLGSAGLLRQNS